MPTENNAEFAIVLAVFGTSSERARAVYGNIEQHVRKAFPGCEIRWAYLSRRIVAKQRAAGIFLPTLDETLDGLLADGFNKAVVQPLLTVPGEEYKRVCATTHTAIELSFGTPLLASEEDFKPVLDAIALQIMVEVPHVLVCHGNNTYPELNAPLLELKHCAEARFTNLHVASVEGQPGEDALDHVAQLVKTSGTVVFVPFMIVAGDHIQNDVMGDEADSWKMRIGARQSICMEPLGCQPAILDIFNAHIRQAIKGLGNGGQA